MKWTLGAILMIAVVVVEIAGGTIVFAQSLITKLPADGTWAKYKLTGFNETNTNAKSKITGQLTIRCLETVYENMEPFQWIETECSHRAHDLEQRFVFKFLVAESNLNDGKHILGDFKKMWFLSSFDGHERIVEVKPGSEELEGILTLLPEPLNKIQTTDEKEFELYFGKVSLRGKSGVEDYDGNAGIKGRKEFTAYQHEKSPFGTVVFQFKREAYHELDFVSMTQHTLQLIEAGTGAESAIPDKK